jgi:hypothetical protein
MLRTAFLSVRPLFLTALALVVAVQLPSSYIVARHDRTIPPAVEKTMVAAIGARTTTLDTCHLALLDTPFKIATIIAACVRDE